MARSLSTYPKLGLPRAAATIPQAICAMRSSSTASGLMEAARLGLELVGQPALGPGMHLAASHPGERRRDLHHPRGQDQQRARPLQRGASRFRRRRAGASSRSRRAPSTTEWLSLLVPEQPALKQVRIANELTEFTYVKDAATYPLILDGYQSS